MSGNGRGRTQPAGTEAQSIEPDDAGPEATVSLTTRQLGCFILAAALILAVARALRRRASSRD